MTPANKSAGSISVAHPRTEPLQEMSSYALKIYSLQSEKGERRQHTTLKFRLNKNVTAFNVFVLPTISQSLIAKALSIQSNKDQNLEIYYENTGNSDKSYPTERRQEDLP